MSEFLQDVNDIRTQALDSVNNGAFTSANKANREDILHLLDTALATEWICVLRYYQHAATASGINADSIREHFAEHAGEELKHANQLAERIQQLGGNPVLEPEHLKQKAHSYYKECDSLAEMIEENLIAERIAIISYTGMIRHIGDSDPTTRRLLEDILAVEEEHANEMSDLLTAFDAREPLHQGTMH